MPVEYRRHPIELDEVSELKKHIAHSIKQQRISEHVTQKELAYWTKVSYGSLRRFESTGEISLDSFLRLETLLGWKKRLKDSFLKDLPYCNVSWYMLRCHYKVPKQKK